MAVVETLSDVKDQLLDIQRTTGEILGVLDVIEQNRNGWHRCRRLTGTAEICIASQSTSSSLDPETNATYRIARKTAGKIAEISAAVNHTVEDNDSLTKHTEVSRKHQGIEVSHKQLDTEVNPRHVELNTETDKKNEELDAKKQTSGNVKNTEDRVACSSLEKNVKDEDNSKSSKLDDRAVTDFSSSENIAFPHKLVDDRNSNTNPDDPNVDSNKPVEGFTEDIGFSGRFSLTFDHVMYGSQLQRHQVDLNQDNRLCEKFDLKPNMGSIYTSQRSPLEDDEGLADSDALFCQPSQLHLSPEQKYSEKKPRTNENMSEKHTEKKKHNFHCSNEVTDARKQDRAFSSGNSGMKTEGLNQTNCQETTRTERINQLPVQTPSKAVENTNSRKAAANKMPVLDEEMAHNLAINLAAAGHKLSREDWVNLMMELKGPELAEQGSSQEAIRRIVEASVFQAIDENGELKGDLKDIQQRLVEVMYQVADSRLGSSDSSGSTSGGSNHIHYTQTRLQLKPAPEAVESTSEEETEEELVKIDPDQWVFYANKEIEKGRVAREVRERGMDTIFCLDISRSMKGIAWQQAVDFIKNFIEGIQDRTLDKDVYEHIALVTFGNQTCVQQHLTCDYLEIIRKLDELQLGGTSPMYAGLQMVHATLIGSGAVLVVNGYKIHPRVFLITDGKATPTAWSAGPDRCSQTEFLMEQIPVIGLVKELHKKFHININPVPVGSFDLMMLERIAKESEGKIVSPTDWKLQSRTFRNYLRASKVGCVSPEFSALLLDAVTSNASPEDKVQMEEFLKTHKRGSEDSDNDQENEGVPPLGSRVRLQEPGSSTANIFQACKGLLGTVTKHFSDGFVGVTWDRPRINGTLREKMLYLGGEGNITLVDSPRVLHNEMIAVGCCVRRGNDWHYGNQDGGAGNIGTVFDVDQNGIVKVRWANGHKNQYRFGAEGKFDLEVIGQEKEDVDPHFSQRKATGQNGDNSQDKKVEEMNKRNTTLITDLQNSDRWSEQAVTDGISVMSDIGLSAGNPEGATQQTSELQSFEDIMNAKNSKIVQNVQSLGTRKSESKVSQSEEDVNARNTGEECYSSGKETEQAKLSTTDNDDISPGEATPSVEFAGTRPKTVVKSVTDQDLYQSVQWLWKEGDTWQFYPKDICLKIESAFKQNPKGTTVVRLLDAQLRIIFSRMEQVNVKTKEKHTIERKIS